MSSNVSINRSDRRRLPWALVALTVLAVGALPLAAVDMSTVAPPAGAVPESLTGSYVAFDPSVGGDICYMPGVPQTFCFIAYSYSPDWEYVYNVWEKFPTDWTVTNVYVQGTPTCNVGTWGTFGWSFQTSPYEVNIAHARYQASGGDACTAYYCFEVVSGTGAPDALVSWFWDGDGYASTPHWPCSSDGYTPAGQSTCDEAVQPPAAIPPCVLPPVMLTPASVEAEGCPGVPQVHTFTAWNNAGYDMTMDMEYTIVGGTGTCSGPDTVAVANAASVAFDVDLTPIGAAGDTTVCQIEAVDPGNPANYDESLLTKHIFLGGWDPAGWQNQNITGATTVQWGSCAVGGHPSVTGPVGYYLGGLAPGSVTQAVLQMYDPGADAWTQLPVSPVGLFSHVASFIDGRLYVSGGYDAAFTGSTDLQVFDPLTNTWDNTTYPDVPAARGGASGGAGICHTGTGWCHFQVGGGPTGSFAATTRDTWEFNPATNTWTQLDSRPQGSTPDGITLGGGVGCLGYVFVGGDYRGFKDFFGLDATMASGSQWVQLANIPADAGSMTPAMVCSEDESAIYLIGGDPYGYWSTYNNTVYRYSIVDDTWSGPLPQLLNIAETGSCALNMADRLWTFGGTIGSGPIAPVPHESLTFITCPSGGLPWSDGFETGDTSMWSLVYDP